jgi:ribosomal protein RSM22 (predicted rRNA methylase)
MFARIHEVMPGFAPQSLLDVGAGTGAASWAAIARWPEITSLTMLDRNPALRALARKLADLGSIGNADILAGELEAEKPKADLVVASYVLAEQPKDKIGLVVGDLWRCSHGALALVEPGTPEGFDRIRTARSALIELGAHVVAPCTHEKPCPIEAGDWCHFSQRLARTRDHMFLKQASVPFEDERYSYIVVAREKASQGARILSPPLDTKPGLTFKLCDAQGLHAHFVAARDKEEFRRVRKLAWGDLF